MTTFDYGGEAELFPPRNRKYPHKRFGYRRFALAANAVRFAIEQLPPELLIGAILEVDGKRYGGEQIIGCTTATIFPFSGTRRAGLSNVIENISPDWRTMAEARRQGDGM